MGKTQLDYVFCPFCGKYLETTIEEGRELKYCQNCQWRHYLKHDIAVAGIIIRYNTTSYREPYFEVLMVLRNKEPSKGMWSFPAGFVNFGEHPDDALAREVYEETSLGVVRSKLIEEVVSDDDPRSPKQLSRFYKVFAIGKVKIRDKEENSQIAWWVLDLRNPLPNIAWENHRRLFRQIRDGEQFSQTSPDIGWWLSEVR